MYDLIDMVVYYLDVNNIEYEMSDFCVSSVDIIIWDTAKLGSRPEYGALRKLYKNKVDWENVRARRDALLKDCDWTQAKDVTDAVSSAWAPYRQALRDIPQNFTNPDAIVWPTKP